MEYSVTYANATTGNTTVLSFTKERFYTSFGDLVPVSAAFNSEFVVFKAQAGVTQDFEESLLVYERKTSNAVSKESYLVAGFNPT